MGTDKYPGLQRGTVDSGGYVIDAIANAAIAMWSPVVWVTDSSITNGLPRVQTTTNANDPLMAGVVIDGPTQGGTSGANAASAAGQAVRVCILGRVKVQVLGSSGGNIVIGNALTSSTSAGIAELSPNNPTTYDSTARRNILGYALQASTADNDYIVMLVNRNG